MAWEKLYFAHPNTDSICELNYFSEAEQFDIDKNLFIIFGPIKLKFLSKPTTIVKKVIRSFMPYSMAFPAFNVLIEPERGKEVLALVEVLDNSFPTLDSKKLRLQVIWNLLYSLFMNGSALVCQSADTFKDQITQYLTLIRSLLLAEQQLNTKQFLEVEENESGVTVKELKSVGSKENPGLTAATKEWLNSFIVLVENSFREQAKSRNLTSLIEPILSTQLPNIQTEITKYPVGMLVSPLLDINPLQQTLEEASKTFMTTEAAARSVTNNQILVKCYLQHALTGFYGIKPGVTFAQHNKERIQLQQINGRKPGQKPGDYRKQKYFSGSNTVNHKLLSLAIIIQDAKRKFFPEIVRPEIPFVAAQALPDQDDAWFVTERAKQLQEHGISPLQKLEEESYV